jgi:hypothetical protein
MDTGPVRRARTSRGTVLFVRLASTVMIHGILPRLLATLVLASGTLGGCGARATTARTAEPGPPSAAAEAVDDAAREWVWVEAPRWTPEVISASTRTAADDYCITSGSNRACVRDGAWRDVAMGSGYGWLMLTGRAGEDWVFEDQARRVFVARPFTGALRELPQDQLTIAVGRGWQPPARRTVDGALLVWAGAGFTPLPFPGRVYDAAFSQEGLGIALVEPGVVYLREAQQPWAAALQPSGAPSSIAQLDGATLPEGFAALVDDAPGRSRVMDPEFEREVTRAWLTEQMRRFAQHHGVTLPDLLPALRRYLLALHVLTPPDGSNIGDIAPLAHGWLARAWPDVEREQLFRVHPDLTMQPLAEGPNEAILVGHDGNETLALGGACDHDPEESPIEDLGCYTDAAGSRTVQFPPGVACADVLALGSGQLLAGGEDCPASACGEHLLVRFDLLQGGAPLDAIPVPIEGEVSLEERPVDQDECYLDEDSSFMLPDGNSVRGVVSTADGDRFLAGPLGGTLRSLPLPAEGAVAFADAQHGVLVARDSVWSTSDGGESWDAMPPAAPGRFALPDPSCSADACRVADRYWMPADLAQTLGFARTAQGPTHEVDPEEQRQPLDQVPWRTTPPAHPSLTPSNALAPLRQTPPSHWRSRLSRVVGGVVATNPARPEHTGDFTWRGVTPQGVPFHVETTATDPVTAAPLQFNQHEVLAMTERFVALLLPAPAPASGAAAPMQLLVVRRNGQSSRHPALIPPLPLSSYDTMTWPLPLPDGGLGVYVFHPGKRWLVRFSQDGDVVAQRAFPGLGYVRDEAVAWHEGELGLAVSSGAGLARMYLVTGGEREITEPRTPEGPCTTAANAAANRFASTWGSAQPALRRAIALTGSWVSSEEHGGHACMRAWAAPLTPRFDDGAAGTQLVLATGAALRGWFISAQGTAEWPVTFPGVRLPVTRSDSVTPTIGLTATRAGLELWVPVASHPVPAGVSRLTWETSRFIMHDPQWGEILVPPMVDTRPGFLLVGHGAFPISDGVVQPPREAPQGTRLVDAVRVEGGETLVTALNRNDVHVDWPGAQGERLHAEFRVPSREPSRWWARLTSDGQRLVELTTHPQGGHALRVHHLRPDGTLQTGSALELDEDMLGTVTQLRVASAGPTVVASIATTSGAPLHVLGTSRTGAFRLLGHPIGTGRCEPNVLALSAAPPRVVWVDCALGTEQRFVRVAQLAGSRWREVVPAHALPEGRPSVAAVIDARRGVHVVYVEDGVVVLVTPQRAGWEVVTRYGSADPGP